MNNTPLPPPCLGAPTLSGPRSAAEQLSEQLRRLHRLISASVMNALQTQLHDQVLSFSQITALHHLRAHAPQSISALAEQLRVSLPAASQLVQGLVTQGLVARRENPGNRREKLLDLSDQGREFLERTDVLFTGAYAAALADVPLATLQQAVSAVTAVLEHAQAAQAAPHKDQP